MKIAILSDIHSNIEALTTVQERMQEIEIDKAYCLGDIVGYGPNPLEIIRKSKEMFEICILGNHDEAVLKKPEYFNKIPEDAVYWTKDVLDQMGTQEDWDYLRTMKGIHREHGLIFSHGILDDNMSYATEAEDLFFIFDEMENDDFLCLGGHSHQPSVWVLEDNELSFYEADPNVQFQLNPKKKYWINVGSVGQPRDHDNRACFLVYDSVLHTAHFERVDYDYKKTAEKIRSIDRLDNFLAERLEAGI